LLIWEDGDVLRLGAGIPRSWLRDNATIRVERAASRFGPLHFAIHSQVARGRILAEIEPPQRNPPAALVLRLRHPDKLPFQRVVVNGQPADAVAVAREEIRLPPTAAPLTVEVYYEAGSQALRSAPLTQ